MLSTKKKSPPSGTRPATTKTCASNNHCFTSDILYLNGSNKRKGSPSGNFTEGERKSPREETRLLSRDVKITIFEEMFRWKTEGGESPVGRLVKEFGVHRNTPNKLLNKVVKKGT